MEKRPEYTEKGILYIFIFRMWLKKWKNGNYIYII